MLYIHRLEKNASLHLKMNQHDAHLLDLPKEILFLILRKLENVDVLYYLMDINNHRLDCIVQDAIFTNILNFMPTLQPASWFLSISSTVLDRFDAPILPRIHEYVKSLTIDSSIFWLMVTILTSLNTNYLISIEKLLHAIS